MFTENYHKIKNIVNSLRLPNEVMTGKFLNLISENDERACEQIIEKYPYDLTENLFLAVHKIITENDVVLWKAAFYDCLMDHIHSVLGENPIYSTATLAHEKGNPFIAELIADFLCADIFDIESKNSIYTIFDYPYKEEMFTVKFMFLQKGTMEEIHIEDAVEGQYEVKLFVCYTSED